MTVGSVSFQFDAVLVHPESLDLVILEATDVADSVGLPAKLDGLARSLDVLRSRRSITLVLIGPRPENAIVDRLGQVSRLLFADVPTGGDFETALGFALAVLLPLNVEPAPDEPAESWRTLAGGLRAQVQDPELSPIIAAAPHGADAVTRELRALVIESFDQTDA
jgi:hypothetical protein